MYKAFKTLHIIGMALFLGSIFAHIAAGRVPAAETEPAAMVFTRQTIDLATRYVTLPGLGLAIVSGILMVLLGPADALKAAGSSPIGAGNFYRRPFHFQ